MATLSSLLSSSGGGSVKPYKLGMTVKQGECVRSAKNWLPYVRYSNSPEIYTMTDDPADSGTQFILDDPTTQIGTIQSFPDVMTGANTTYSRYGQLWARTGSYVDITTLARPVPKELVVHYDVWSTVQLNSNIGLGSVKINHMVADNTGTNLMAINANGILYRSSNSGASWSTISSISTNGTARLATNNNGRWWFCNGTGEVYVSDNFGDGWTKQQTPSAAAPAVFKYVNGKLYYSSGAATTVAGASGSAVVFLSLPDTNSQSTTWSALSFPLAQGTGVFGSGVSVQMIDIVGNGVDVIWAVGTLSNSYLGIFLYNSTTLSWQASSVGAGNRIQGLCYDDLTGYAWFAWAYWANNSSNTNAYESVITNTGVVSTTTNPFRPASVWNQALNVYAGACYIRRGGSAFMWYNDGTGSNGIFYKQGSGLSTPAGRVPAVSGSITAYGGWRNVVVGGNKAFLYGDGLSVSSAVVGLPTNRSPAAGYTDYFRVQ